MTDCHGQLDGPAENLFAFTRLFALDHIFSLNVNQTLYSGIGWLIIICLVVLTFWYIYRSAARDRKIESKNRVRALRTSYLSSR